MVHWSRSTALVTTISLATSVVVSGCHSPAAAPKNLAPAIALVTPAPGFVSNGVALDVRVQAAAVQAGPGAFAFAGNSVPGSNRGVLTRVEVAVDGVALQTLDTQALGAQALAHFSLDVSTLAPGAHSLTAKAFSSEVLSQTVSGTFVVDRTQPKEVNRVEQAGEPEPFAAFDAGPGSATRAQVDARIVPGALGQAFDPTRDQAVIALGGEILTIQPAQWHCDAQGCTFTATGRSLHDVSLRAEGAAWLLHLGGLTMPADPRLFVRLGCAVGGVDLATGELLAAARPGVDTGARKTAVIGAAGGSIDAVDSRGVAIHLDVPPGALAADTSITVTPFLSSAVGSAAALAAGVELAPEGLHFAQSAMLTLDFHASANKITATHQLALVTSPLTAVPLLGKADVTAQKLTAQLYHFSRDQAGAVDPGLSDPSWANAASGPLSDAEIASLIALEASQQLAGCKSGCIDPVQLLKRVEDSIKARIAPICSAAPTDQNLLELDRLEGMVEILGGNVPALSACFESELRGLIADATLRAQINLSDASFAKLLSYDAIAQLRGLTSLEPLIIQGLDSALRALLAKAQELDCQKQFDSAVTLLHRGQTWQAQVASIDSALAGDLAAALTDAQANHGVCVAMTAVINPSTTDPNNDGQTDLEFFRRADVAVCDNHYVNPAGSTDFQDCSGTFHPFFGGPQSAPPTTLSGSVPGLQSSWSVTTPSVNVLALDATASAAPAGYGSGGIYAEAVVDLTFTKPGVLTGQINTSWATLSAPYPKTAASAAVVNLKGFTTNFTVYYDYNQGTGLPGMSTHIDSACTVGVNLQYHLGQSSTASGTGAGRVLTLTFVPDAP